MTHLHNEGIYHGDIKVDNILLDSSMNPILTDFGFATTLGVVEYCQTGTTRYNPPEYFTSPLTLSIKQHDIWALGVLLYLLTLGIFPFEEGPSPKSRGYSKIKYG